MFSLPVSPPPCSGPATTDRPARASAAAALAGLALLAVACSSSPPAPDAGAPDAGEATPSGEAAPAESAPATGRRVEEIAVGWSHSCARLSDGGVWCWGSNKHG